tara:strand:- start:274 stop:435 length:162 start_codon:yes stop_codon:yes gene_type:complete
MQSKVLDDFIDDCFLSGDDICKFEIYKSRKYEKRVNPIASELIKSTFEQDEKT